MITLLAESTTGNNSSQTGKGRRTLSAYWSCVRGDDNPPFPLQIRLDITSACNLRCPHCPQTELPADQKVQFPFEVFGRLMEEIKPYQPELNLHHRGESLLNNRFPAYLRLALQSGSKCRLHTNGTRLDKPLGRALLLGVDPNSDEEQEPLSNGVAELSFSLDAFDAETYAVRRPGGDFEDVLRRIREFVALRKQLNRYQTKVTLQIIHPNAPVGGGVEKNVKDEVLSRRMRELSDSVGLESMDRVFVKPPHDWAGNVEIDESLQCSSIEGDKETGNNGGGCIFPWYDVSVLADGRVSVCPQDYFGTLILGDLKKQSLAEIWNGQIAKELRAAHSADREGDQSKLPSLCKTCSMRTRKRILGIPKDRILPMLRRLLG